MKVLYKEHPRTIAVYSDNHTLCFRQLDKAKASQNRSKIQPAVAVEVIPNSQITKESGYRVLVNREVFGCLGLINVERQLFLAVITGAITNVASPVNYETVDKIYSVDFISLSSNEWDFVNLDANGYPVETNETNEDFYEASSAHPCQDLKKLLSNGSFYYSNDFDLTSLLQSRGINSSKLNHEANNDLNASKKSINLEHYQQQYMWNSFMMEELIKFRSNLDEYAQELLNDNKFLTTVIRGFAKTVTFSSSGAAITIVSKQSWKRAGTRFLARGIDDNGNVANFVETEFIYDNPSQHLIFAFTQIRGSVPTFWEQDSTLINPKITLTRSQEATQPIFNKHFDEICSTYGVCHIVNLLSRTKPAELQILRRYKDLYKNSTHVEDIAFSDFDFHHETKQLAGGFSGATKILGLLQQSLEQFGWFAYDTRHREVITRQDGVFRVNCLDCLDRTNLIQQVISLTVLENIYKNYFPDYGKNYQDRVAFEEMSNKHNVLWADHGDAISQIYTGTNALKSSFSRSGKMNFAGALSDVTKSVSRMYQNTFVDSKKQSTMDLLLGYDAQTQPVKIYDPINEYVHEKIKQQAPSFTTWNDINLFVGTYNISAANPMNQNIDLSSWLFPPQNLDHGLPDVYAIGFQEMIELNAGSILSADNSKPLQWAKVLGEQLNSQNEQFLLLRTESIASMSLFLFVKKSQVHNVTQVAGSSKKTGLGGIAANKGACAVRFEFGLTSFALVTSHLAAGTNATIERFNDYQTIMQGLTFTRNYTIKDHDHVIWFGDLNYRLALPNDKCRYLIENGAFDELIKVDQLMDELDDAKGGAFRGFKEGKIKFYPTYKFDKGTSNYDSSEKQRVPSWTDRILYMTNKEHEDELNQLNYSSSMNINLSDHKPVFSTFNSKVEFIDEEKKLQLSRDIYYSYKSQHGDQGEVSLIEFSNNSASGKSSPSSNNDSDSNTSSSNTNFTSDTLSEMNLLDDDNFAPKLPSRSTIQHDSHVPRRIPPPPLSRKSFTTDFTASNNNNNNTNGLNTTPSLRRKLPPTPDYDAKGNMRPFSTSSQSPAPPPTRKTVSNNDQNSSVQLSSSQSTRTTKPPIGFSSTPLIPSNSGSSTPTPKAASPRATPKAASPKATLNASTSSLPSTKVEAKSSTTNHMKPMIPTKPSALSSTKSHTGQPNLTSNTSISAPASALASNNTSPNRSASNLNEGKPIPPAPRSNINGSGSMSDWKPLVPQ